MARTYSHRFKLAQVPRRWYALPRDGVHELSESAIEIGGQVCLPFWNFGDPLPDGRMWSFVSQSYVTDYHEINPVRVIPELYRLDAIAG